MPQPKANPICHATPVLTFPADSHSQIGKKRTLLPLIAWLLFAAKQPSFVLINGNRKVILPRAMPTSLPETT
jgi:hypothetical protein